MINDIRKLIIAPALKAVGLYSPAAEILLTGTLMLESNALAIVQNDGPALGVFQIEPTTHSDIKRSLSLPSSRYLLNDVFTHCYFSKLPDDAELISNIKYSCLVARFVYLRSPMKITLAEDRERLAFMYKAIYNTSKGEAEMDKCIEIFKSIPCNSP